MFVWKSGIQEHQIALAKQLEASGVDPIFITFENAQNGSFVSSANVEINFIGNRVQLMRLVQSVSANYCVLGTPYEEHYPRWFVASPGLNLIYAGYALPVKLWFSGAYLNPLLSRTQLIISGSRRDHKLLKSHYPAQAIKAWGNPLLWNLLNSHSIESSTGTGVKEILWAPHWSPAWDQYPRGFSRINETAQTIHAFFDSPRASVIRFRPHPLLLRAIMVARGFQADNDREVQSVLANIKPRTIEVIQDLEDRKLLSFSTSTMIQDISSSALLITEGVSILGYWPFTGKPVFVIRDADSPLFDREGEAIIRFGSIGNSSTDLEQFLKSHEITVSKKSYALKVASHFAFFSRLRSPGKKLAIYVKRNAGR